MGLKRRGATARRQVLNLTTKKQEPQRHTWQTKYQQICAEHSQRNGDEEGSGGGSETRANPLQLVGEYQSDSDSHDSDHKESLDAKVSDFLKEIESIVPKEQPASAPPPAPTAPEKKAPATAATQELEHPGMAWQECYDEGSGYVYYWNVQTNAVTWDVPPEYQAYAASVDPAQWVYHQQQLAYQHQAAAGYTMGQPPAGPSYDTSYAHGVWLPDTTQQPLELSPDPTPAAVKSDASDSEEERIVMITSYGPASDEESEEDAPAQAPTRKRKARQGKGQSKKMAQMIGPMFPPEDTGPPGVDSEEYATVSTRVEKEKPVKTGTEVKLPNVDSPVPRGENDGTDSVETDERLILSRLRSQARILRELGGEIPDEIRQLIDNSVGIASPAVEKPAAVASAENSPCPASFALIAGYGDDSDEEKALSDSQGKKERKARERDETPVQEYGPAPAPEQMSAVNGDAAAAEMVQAEMETKLEGAVPPAVSSEAAVPDEVAPVDVKPDRSVLSKVKAEKVAPVEVKPDRSVLTKVKVEKVAPVEVKIERATTMKVKPDKVAQETKPERLVQAESKSEQSLPAQVKSEKSLSAQVKSEKSLSAQVKSEKSFSAQVKSEKSSPAQTKLEKSSSAQEKLLPVQEKSLPAQAKSEKSLQGQVAKLQNSLPAQANFEKSLPAQANFEKSLPAQVKSEKMIPTKVRAERLRAEAAQAKEEKTKSQNALPAQVRSEKANLKMEKGSTPEVEKAVVAEADAKLLQQKKQQTTVLAELSTPSDTSTATATATSAALLSTTSYTTSWPSTGYNSDPSGGERRGFGFQRIEEQETVQHKKGSIKFVKAETINLPQQTEGSEEGADTQEMVQERADLVLEKVRFLAEGKEPVPPVQEMAIQIETLVSAWQSGALTRMYLSSWLGQTGAELARLEKEAAPQGWACDWDRTYKRYYYCNLETGSTQWEYPELPGEDVVGAGDEMEICCTPPPPPATSPPPPPPPPQISPCQDPSPPPPPRISEHEPSPPPPPPPPPPPDLQEEEQPPLPPLPPVEPPPPPPPDSPPPHEEPLPPGVDTPELPYVVARPYRAPPPPSDLDGTPMYEESSTSPGAGVAPLQYVMAPAAAPYQVAMMHAMMAMPYPHHTISRPAAKARPQPPPDLHDELDSFYSDLATLQTSPAAEPCSDQNTPDPQEPVPEPEPAPAPAPEPAPEQEQLPVSETRKRKKTKLTPGLALKKKGVSSLVAKWQQVQQEVRRDMDDDPTLVLK